MGRPPSNGSPAFRFSSNEVAEMENILREHKAQVPSREVLEALAGKFSSSEERSGKIKVQAKQVWNWFQNRRFALRAKQTKPPEMFSTPPPLPRFNAGQSVHQAPNAVRTVPQAPQLVTSQGAVQGGGRLVSDNSPLEFEAKSARDGAWYDVASFLSHRSLETDEPDVLVRFAGFGSEEDEWVNVRKHVRPRSLPCEASECVVILPGDLILCFQEGKEQALYYDAHVIDSQRRRHDVRGCRCRFLVRYDHDQSEEIVPLRKVCRRPETDYRLLQLQSMNESGASKQQKTNVETSHMGNTLRVYPPSEPMPKPQKAEESLPHVNRSKIVQTKNPEMGAGVALKPPAVPPGFEAVTSGTAKISNTSGETSIAMEVKSPETSNHEVITPVVTEVESLETKNSEVITPLATETLQTKNPEVSAGGLAETSTLIAVEVKSPETKNLEVGAGDGGETTAVFPSNDVLTSGAVGDDTLVAPVVENLDSEVRASDGVKFPTVPPGFEAVTGVNTPVTMEVESPQTRNTEVTAGDIGGTSTNEALTSGTSPNSKTSVNASAAMEVEPLETKKHEITAGDVGGTLTNEAVTSGASPNSKTSADASAAMEVESLQTKGLEVGAGDAAEISTIPSNKVLASVDTSNCKANDLAENMLEG